MTPLQREQEERSHPRDPPNTIYDNKDPARFWGTGFRPFLDLLRMSLRASPALETFWDVARLQIS